MAASGSTAKRALAGMAVALGAFVLVEVALQLALGRPPQRVQVADAEKCTLVVTDGGVEGHCPDGLRQWSRDDPRPRVVVVGASSMRDTFTGVTDVPTRLGRLLPEVEVVNLAWPGAVLEEFIVQAEAIRALEPDLLVVYAGHNDVGRETELAAEVQQARGIMQAQAVLDDSWIYTGLVALVGAGQPHEPGGDLGPPPEGGELRPPPEGEPPGPGGPPPSGMGPPPGEHGPPPGEHGPPPGGAPGQPAGPPPPGEGGGFADLPVDAARCIPDPDQPHWRGTLVVAPTGLQERMSEVSAKIADRVQRLIDGVDTTVLIVPPVANAEHPPAGTTAVDEQACGRLVRCIARPQPGDPWPGIAEQAAKDCGPDAAWTLWAEAMAAHDLGQEQEAVARFEASLDADPIAIRAGPGALDGMRRMADSRVHQVELEAALGAWKSGAQFHDQLHFTEDGAERVAQALAPVVSALLAGEPMPEPTPEAAPPEAEQAPAAEPEPEAAPPEAVPAEAVP